MNPGPTLVGAPRPDDVAANGGYDDIMMWLWLGLALAAPGSDGPVVIDRVVVDVAGNLVLRSDVEREAILATVDRGGTPFWDPSWRTAEDRLIDAAIIRTIAADVRLYEPSRQDVQRRLEAMRAQFPDRRSWRAFLDRIAADEDRLLVILRRRLVVDRYLSRNLLVDPSDRQAFRAAAEAHLGELRRAARVRRIPEASRRGASASPPRDATRVAGGASSAIPGR